MNVYVKGGIVCALIIGGVLGWFFYSRDSLSVYKKPDQFSKIDDMEKQGIPDFTLPRLDDSAFQSSSTRGKVVIVNFWASSCNPCVEEFPSLIKLIDKFAGEVLLVAVSADEEKKDIEAFLKAFGLPKPNIEILWDKDRKIAEKFGVSKVPESFLVGKDGKLIRKIIGIENWFTEGSVAYFSELTRANH